VTPSSPAFLVRAVPVYGDAILAPMAGFSDTPYRSICREHGSAMSYSEFVAVESLRGRGVVRARQTLSFAPLERPVVFQMFGVDEAEIVAACQRVEAWGPDIIDINLGCSTPKVAGRGAGAGMLSDPAKIGRVFARLTHALRVPVTAKIRLGPERRTRNHVEVARVLEENGAALVAVHGRTRDQNYGQPADWDAIAEVRQVVKIPVLGNGDVMCAADIDRIKLHTGCDGVLIGRAAIGNPWIFQRRDWERVPLAEKMIVVRRHLAAMVDVYGAVYGVILFRKHLVRYLRGLPDVTTVRNQLLALESADEVLRLLGEYEAWVIRET